MSKSENKESVEKKASGNFREKFRHVVFGLNNKEVKALVADADNTKLSDLIANKSDLLIRVQATNELIRRSRKKKV